MSGRRDYKGAWEELNRVLTPAATIGLPHRCGDEDHEEEVDVLDCIAERFGLRS